MREFICSREIYIIQLILCSFSSSALFKTLTLILQTYFFEKRQFFQKKFDFVNFAASPILEI